MPNLTFTSKYKFVDGLIIAPSTIISEYMHGIPLSDISGKRYPIEQFIKKIKTAQEQLEKFLQIKLFEQEITSIIDYRIQEWMNWAHVKLPYECNELLEVKGYLSLQEVIDINKDMFTVQGKNLALVPGQALQSSLWIGRSGSFPVLRSGAMSVPNFWHIKYKTGFPNYNIPYDIMSILGKMVSIQILGVIGDVVLNLGISNESLSFDGFSQSFGTTQSPGNSVFSARIKQYSEELKLESIQIKQYYRGIVFDAI